MLTTKNIQQNKLFFYFFKEICQGFSQANVTRYFMTKITSKENRKAIWFSIIFSTLFFAAMGTFMIYSFVKMHIANQVETRTFIMPIFGLIVYFTAYSFVKSYLKNSSKIEINKEKLIIENKTYYWKNLKDIKLSGKKGFGLFNYQMEAVTINLKIQQNIFLKIYIQIVRS